MPAKAGIQSLVSTFREEFSASIGLRHRRFRRGDCIRGLKFLRWRLWDTCIRAQSAEGLREARFPLELSRALPTTNKLTDYPAIRSRTDNKARCSPNKYLCFQESYRRADRTRTAPIVRRSSGTEGCRRCYIVRKSCSARVWQGGPCHVS